MPAELASPAEYRNRLLVALPEAERMRIAPHLERVPLARRQLLYDPERPITHVYFVERGLVSLVSVMGDGSAVESATVGVDGMVGMPIFHGVDFTSEQAMAQIPGEAFRLSAAELRAALPEMPALTALLHRVAAFMFTLAAQGSGCNRKHNVEQRCARWLLTVRDRIESDELALTHDFISQMLGVRRASVTETLAALEARGLIRTGRGRVAIVDGPGLERAGCECYLIIRSSSDRLLAGRDVRSPLADVETSRDGFSIVGDGTPIDETVGV